jgi:hypothetical protein
MNKNVILFLGVCAVSGLLVFRLSRPVANPVPPAEKPAASVLPVATAAWVGATHISAAPRQPLAGTALVQSQQESNSSVEFAVAVTNNVGEDTNEIAQQEIFRLLRELRDLAAKNPEDALAAVMKLPEGDERNQALAAVCQGLADTDPADAVELAQNLQLDKQPGALLENLVQQWAKTDLSSALDWVNSQAAGEERDGLMLRVAYVTAQSDPAHAAQFVAGQMPPGPAQDEAAIMVLHQWAVLDSTGASAWAQQFPESPLRNRALNELSGVAQYNQGLAQSK